MRWKLLIVASLLAAVAGAGACYAASLALAGPASGGARWWPTALLLVAPLGATAYASIFVYRHTARRRALQAAATAMLALLLMLTALLVGSLFARGRAPLYFPEPAAPDSAS